MSDQDQNEFKISPEEIQKTLEERFIENVSPCFEADLELINTNFYGMNEKTLQEIVKTSFFSQEAMKTSECFVNSLFYISKVDSGSTELNDRIRRYITNMQKIENPSAEAEVFVADFGEAEGFFVIKTAKNSSNDFLIHELLVGLYGTNKLRNFVPNFAYVYGGFKCSPPIIDEATDQVLSFCDDNTNKINYVIYENIFPSVTLDEYIKTCSGEDFLKVYLQIFYALKKALELIDFTHYDLHTNNVLIRQFSEDFQIPYETVSGSQKINYIKTNVIATIIDYGFSHILTMKEISKSGKNVNPLHFGRFGREDFNVNPDKSWIKNDLYKLLMTSMRKAYSVKNIEVIQIGEKIYEFFSNNTVLTKTPPVEEPKTMWSKFKGVLTQKNDPVKNLGMKEAVAEGNFSLPFEHEFDQVNFIFQLHNHIEDSFGEKMTSHPDRQLKVLNCSKNACKNAAGILRDIGYKGKDKMALPNDVTEFITLLEKFIDGEYECGIKTLIRDFKGQYSNKIQKASGDLKRLINEVLYYSSQISYGEIAKIQKKGLSYIETIRLMYVRLIDLFNKIRKIKLLYEACVKTMKIYENNSYGISDLIGGLVRGVDGLLVNLMEIVNENKRFIFDEKFEWFNEERKKFDLAIEIGYTRYIQLKEEYLLLRNSIRFQEINSR